MGASGRGDPLVCLVTFGSAGDVHPMLALGRSLQARGHAVKLLTNPAFADAASRAGVDFAPVGELRHQQETIGHPKLWHPIDGFGVMWRYMLRPALQPTYQRLAELAATRRCIVVANPVAMGARIAQEHLGLPLITAYTAATMLRSVQHPLTVASWRVPRWMPQAMSGAAWSLLDRFKLEPLVRPALEALRGSLGLRALDQSVFGRWMHSPQAGAALFPQWFAPAATDWPAQVVQSGFPLYDEQPLTQPTAALTEFMNSGGPPVVFMPGTARQAVGDFFSAAVKACQQTGQRGLLLGQVDEALLRSLPPTVRAEPYVPFGWLLPRARALVHHGGVGSCAQALRAGIPQLIAPHAYDQFDNAMRIENLGVGAVLMNGPHGLQEMGGRLRHLLGSVGVQEACKRWATQTRPEPAFESVAALVERLS